MSDTKSFPSLRFIGLNFQLLGHNNMKTILSVSGLAFGILRARLILLFDFARPVGATFFLPFFILGIVLVSIFKGIKKVDLDRLSICMVKTVFFFVLPVFAILSTILLLIFLQLFINDVGQKALYQLDNNILNRAK